MGFLNFLFEAGGYIGVSIGTDVSNIPTPLEIVSILRSKKIRHVRLFDADHKLLAALSKTGIEVIVGLPNKNLLKIGESRTAAADWINQNVAAFIPDTNITFIAVGSEVLTTIPNAALVLVPAMQFLRSALVAANLDSRVKVSSPSSMDMIPVSFPPSTATFNSSWNSVMIQMLRFLKNTNSSFMLNANTYRGYTQAAGIFPLEYALFRPLSPEKQIVDPNTGLHYKNMFDGMVDAVSYSIEALNFTGIPVLVTETGWPSHGDENEPDANIDNAIIYNNNLINHILSNSGENRTNSSTSVLDTVNAYIHELFNEDLLTGGPVSDKNYGLFSSNGSIMYNVNFIGVYSTDNSSNEGPIGVFCVANATADSTALLDGLNWACGPGSANCDAIQPGQPCYSSDIISVASYAYDEYYHRSHAAGGTCDFGHTAFLTTVDPSHGSCVFAGRLESWSFSHLCSLPHC